MDSELKHIPKSTYEFVLLTIDIGLFTPLLHRCIDYYLTTSGIHLTEDHIQAVIGMMDRDRPHNAVGVAEEIGQFDMLGAAVVREAIRWRRCHLDEESGTMLVVRTETGGVVRDCLTAFADAVRRRFHKSDGPDSTR